MKIPHADLRLMVTNAFAFAGTDDTLPILCGVNFEAKDGVLTLLATDRYKLLRQRYVAPKVRDGVDGNGRDIMVDQAAEAWSFTADRALLKATLAMVKAELPAFVTLELSEAEISGHKVQTVDGTFPDIERLMTGRPECVDPEYTGRVGCNPSHFSALDKLRTSTSRQRHAPAFALRIMSSDMKAKPIFFEPLDQRDGLTIDGLLMPVKI